MTHKLTLSTVIVVASLGLAGTVSATEQIAAKLNTTDCNKCHSSPIQSKTDLRPGVSSAYNQDQRNLTGLKAFLAQSPAVKPAINPIAVEWDAEVGQRLEIPLSVSNVELGAFRILGKLAGLSFSADYIADSGLPTIDLQWTPTAAQANKAYTLKLTAQETLSAKKLSSVPKTVKIRVWPQGNRDTAYISKLMVATSKWANNMLTLKGKVILNPLMTAAEKSAFLQRTDLTVSLTQGTSGTGMALSPALALHLQSNGSWILADIPLPAPVPCSLTVSLDGAKASRTLNGAPKDCVK